MMVFYFVSISAYLVIFESRKFYAMQSQELKYNRLIWILIGISLAIRFLFAYLVEFGNDEVYYWLLSSYPALSYFDHPPLLFVFINLFTFGHWIDAEWAIRLPSLIAVSASTWLTYDIGKRIKSARAGFFAALLAQCSFYVFIISGFFVIPDGLLSFFWVAALRSALIFFNAESDSKAKNLHLLLFGMFVGLGAITKYHILILWFSFGFYILYNSIGDITYLKRKLSNYRLYLSGLISLVSLTPVVIWNLNNDFSSFKFHESRLSFFGEFEPLFFMRELLGQFAYNNFFVFILVLIALLAWKKRKYVSQYDYSFILVFSLPLVLLFLFFSLFRATLPHWSAPGYYLLIVLVAAYLDDLRKDKSPKILNVTVGFTAVILIVLLGAIQTGMFISDGDISQQTKVENDVTLDIYGWEQMGDKIIERSLNYPTESRMIVAKKWYNAAHLDYYLCRNSDFELMCIGTLSDIHEYERINKERGFLEPPAEALFIQPQRAGTAPVEQYSKIYSEIHCIDTINIVRAGKTAQQVKVFLMKR